MSAVENVGTDAGGDAPATLSACAPSQLLTRTAASANFPAIDIRIFMTSSPLIVCPHRGAWPRFAGLPAPAAAEPPNAANVIRDAERARGRAWRKQQGA